MIPLRILRGFGLWNAGEIAGFEPDRAQQLVAEGFAEPVKGGAEPEPDPAPEPEPRQARTARRAAAE